MTARQFNLRLDHAAGLTADAVVGDTVFQVLVGVREGRRLRAALLEIARMADAPWVKHAVLVLDGPTLSPSRLREEWDGALSVLSTHLLDRLMIMMRTDKHWTGFPTPPSASLREVLEQVLDHERSAGAASVRGSANAWHEILRLLVHQWLLAKGPVTVGWLKNSSGYSHPTVAKILDRFEHDLVQSGRGVELERFPREEWTRLLALSDAARRTRRYTDRSGQPRSPASLLGRLRELQRADVAVGGVAGALHYCPRLDIVGSPRLDLLVHCGSGDVDYEFVQRLDPGLQPTTHPRENATLVVHLLRRPVSLFEPSGDGPPWADPVECLIDLQDARLEPQAQQFVTDLRSRATAPDRGDRAT